MIGVTIISYSRVYAILYWVPSCVTQAVCEEDDVEGTAGDYVEMCRVTVKLLGRRRTQLRDCLSLVKGGMDVSALVPPSSDGEQSLGSCMYLTKACKHFIV